MKRTILSVKVLNTKPPIAKNCCAYLAGVEKVDGLGQFKQTIYGDSITLPWACRGEEVYGPLELPRGIVQFADIVSTRGISADFKPEQYPQMVTEYILPYSIYR
jgi:hypothetical protein